MRRHEIESDKGVQEEQLNAIDYTRRVTSRSLASVATDDATPRTSTISCFSRGYHMAQAAGRPSVTYFRSFLSPNWSVRASESGQASRSHQLLNAVGCVTGISPGSHAILPLAQRSLAKLIKLIDDEMESIGGQKVILPSLVPSSLLKKSNRLPEIKDDLYFVSNSDLLLAPTHEEVVTHLISTLGSLSYKSLPLCLYQIGPKFRHEKRPKGGLLRGREFIMKDMYSFDWCEEEAQNTYNKVSTAYKCLFKRLELDVVQAKADPGNIGGTVSHEYHILNRAGEDVLLMCSSCGCTSNIEVKKAQDKEKEEEKKRRKKKVDANSSIRERGTMMTGEENKDEEMYSCPSCHSNQVTQERAIEVAHTFLLGTRYSSPFNAKAVSPQGKSNLLHMGCYGLGVTRFLAASLECQSNNERVKWPRLIAPFHLVLVPPHSQAAEYSFATQFITDLAYDLAKTTGLDILIDDRSELGIGKRDKDHLLRGIPFIVNAGVDCSPHSLPKLELLDTDCVSLSHGFDSKKASKSLLTHSELFDLARKASRELDTLRQVSR